MSASVATYSRAGYLIAYDWPKKDIPGNTAADIYPHDGCKTKNVAKKKATADSGISPAANMKQSLSEREDTQVTRGFLLWVIICSPYPLMQMS